MDNMQGKAELVPRELLMNTWGHGWEEDDPSQAALAQDDSSQAALAQDDSSQAALAQDDSSQAQDDSSQDQEFYLIEIVWINGRIMTADGCNADADSEVWRERYGKRGGLRIWTGHEKPTEEQRRNTPWGG